MSRLLLDTHTFIWFAFDSPQLSALAKAAIADGQNETLVSIGSIWDATIKASLGKLTIGPDVLSFFDEELRRTNTGLLQIESAHLRMLMSLPLHHRDPFDRLLISQAITEGVQLVSADSNFDSYVDCGLVRLWQEAAALACEIVPGRRGILSIPGDGPSWPSRPVRFRGRSRSQCRPRHAGMSRRLSRPN